MEVKVEKIGSETIKPSSPTPDHLKTYKLSFRDQFSPSRYMPVVLFYPNTTTTTTIASGKKSQLLKESLSETLTRFYPLAGRLRDNLLVDCNDEGVDYLEVRVLNCSLSEVLKQPNNKTLVHFVPTEPKDLHMSPLMLIQFTLFPCGGTAVSVSLTHKITDGVILAAFIKAWSCTILGSPNTVVPDFTAASSRFPPVENFPMKSFSMEPQTGNQKVLTKRFVIDSAKVAALKAKTASTNVEKPTRMEAVTALTWKCEIAASKSRLAGTRKAYALTGAVNLRARLEPPLPEYSLGNVTGLLWAMLNNDEANDESVDVDLSDLVHQLRKGVQRSTDNSFTNQVTKLMQQKGNDMELYRQSSWCRFPLYEADFGWGKPTWMTVAAESDLPIGISLLDAKDGEGVEVLVTLVEQDMALFEGDEEFLAFASPNPSAL